MNRKIKFAEGEYYHIYNRGVDKRDIFLDKSDYNRFISLLFNANSINPVRTRRTSSGQGFTSTISRGETLTNIGAWCLMTNHFHILLKSKDDFGVSKFLQKVTTAYTMYFNQKYNRSGALFQGVFKSEYVDRDEYLKYLFSYIHLNPIKFIENSWKNKGIRDIKRVLDFLDNYNYSSYFDYLFDSRPEYKIITKEVFPEYFLSVDDFKNNILEWLKFRPYQD
jgi:putative transposase